MFLREFWEISKNTLFTEHLRATASPIRNFIYLFEQWNSLSI